MMTSPITLTLEQAQTLGALQRQVTAALHALSRGADFARDVETYAGQDSETVEDARLVREQLVAAQNALREAAEAMARIPVEIQ